MDKLDLTYKFFKMFFLYINLGCVKYWYKLPSLFLDHICVEIIVSSSLMLWWWKFSDTLFRYFTLMEERLHNLLLIRKKLFEFWTDFSTSNSLLNGLRDITWANLTLHCQQLTLKVHNSKTCGHNLKLSYAFLAFLLFSTY